MSKKSIQKIKLAIFDIDGTIFRSSLLIELFRELVRTGIFPRKAEREVDQDFKAWLDRHGHYNDYLMKLIRTHYTHMRGTRPDVVEPIMRKVIREQKHRVYRYTRDLVADLRQKKYYLVAISNSQHYMVQQFCNVFRFDAAVGRLLETKNGHYTGRVLIAGQIFPIDTHIDKVKILKDFLKQHNLQANLTKSIAVGDSEGDLEIMQAVGHPIAFNPSLPLARHARKHGWTVIVERKDVVYNVKQWHVIQTQETKTLK